MQKRYNKRIAGFAVAAFFVLLLLSSYTYAQQYNIGYKLSTVSSSTYTEIAGTVPPWQVTTNTGVLSYGIPIGFNFVYNGTTVTAFKVTGTGYITFDTTVASASSTNDLEASVVRSVVAPLWDSHTFDSVATVNKISYQLSGSAPNRVLTVQWKNGKWAAASVVNANFQLKLYETTNNIEFIYGYVGGAVSGSASIGLSNNAPVTTAGNAFGTFLSVNPADTNNATSFYTSNVWEFSNIPGLISTGNVLIPSGTTLLFTPITTSAMSGSYTVGPTGTFKGLSVVASELNYRGVSGPTTFNVESGTYNDILHLGLVNGVSATNTITFVNSGGTVTLSPINGTTAATSAPGLTAGDAVVRLIGTKYTILDGLNIFEDTTKNVGNSTVRYFEAGYLVANSLLSISSTNYFEGARYNVIKNCTIDMNVIRDFRLATPLSNSGSTGIRFTTSGTLTTDTTKTNSLNTIQDVTIKDFWRSGIRFYGYSGTNPSYGNKVTAVTGRNLLSSTVNYGTASDVRSIEIDAEKDFTLEKTDVKDVLVSNASTTNGVWGVRINSASSSTDYSSGTITIQNCEFSNIETTNSTLTTGTAAAIEVNRLGTNAILVIKNNKIRDIYSNCSTTGRALGIATNIGNGAGFACTLTVANNFISDLRAPRSTGTPGVRGLDVQASAGGNLTFSGYYNTVYLDNTVPPTASAHRSACIYLSNFATSFADLRNNIMINTMGTTTGRAPVIEASASSNFLRIANTSNNNIYWAGSTPSATKCIGHDGTTAFQTINDYKNALKTGGLGGPREVNTFSELPTFVSSTDLHLDGGSFNGAESNGRPIAGFTVDYDGNTRSTTFTDIGADEGSYTQAEIDLYPPVISNVTALANTGSIGNRNITADISDYSGIPNSAPNKPRVYYKKNYAGTWFSSEGTLSSGTVTYGNWSFTINNVDMGGVAVNDTVYYYIIAQDEAGTPNVGAQFYGLTATDVNTVTVHPTTVQTYRVLTGLTGTLYVGAGQTYTSFTNYGGLFQTLNNGIVTGNLTVYVTSDITDSCIFALNQFVTEDNNPYTISIYPNDATVKTLWGINSTDYFRLSGVDRVTIDGRSGGSGRYLLFRTTNTSSSAIVLSGDASDITIRNCQIESKSNVSTEGGITVNAGTTTGNDNLTFTENIVGGRTDSTFASGCGIYVLGSSSAINSNLTITNNIIKNFSYDGIKTSSLNESVTISGNEIFTTDTSTTAMTGVTLNVTGSNNNLFGNTIHDLYSNSTIYGIYLDDAGIVNCYRNKIYNLQPKYGSTSVVIGIYTFGGTTCTYKIYNNYISIIPANANAQIIYGIRDFANASDTTYIYYNSVYVGGVGTGIVQSFALDRNNSTTIVYLRNNIFFNGRTGGTGGHYAGRNTTASAQNLTFNTNYNLWVGLGSAANSPFVLSSTVSTFAQWKASFSHSNNDVSSLVFSADSISADNIFTSKSTGDLSVITGNTTSHFLNGSGIPISGYGDDFAGTSVRNTSIALGTTDIGADEFTFTGAPIQLNQYGNLATGDSSDYYFGNRKFATIYWLSGTPPTSLVFDIRTQEAAAGAPTNSMPLYYTITPTGGSGYTYKIKFYYDEAWLGHVRYESNIGIGKLDAGVYTPDPSAVIDSVNNTVLSSTRSTFSSFLLYDKSPYNITIDGDPTDWVAAAPTTAHETRTQAGEWVYKGVSSDERTDYSGTQSSSDNDITEVRFAQDGSFLYALVKMRDITNIEYPHLCFVITNGTSTQSFIGDDSRRDNTNGGVSTALGNASQYGRLVDVHYTTTPSIELYDGGTWYSSPTGAQVSFSTTNNCVELKIALVDLGLTSSSTPKISLMTAPNRSGWNNDIDGTAWANDFQTNGVDVMTPNTADQNAWFRDLSDGDVDSYASFDLSSAPLPVELSSFTASVKERNVILNWSTSTEKNSYQFIVERQEKNSNEWSSAGTVSASGNSNSIKNYSFTDKKLNSGKYIYRLKMIDNDGTFQYSQFSEAEVGVPTVYAISQNYPNPFNPTTKIDYQLPSTASVVVELYSITGERVAVLVNEEQTAGYYTLNLSANNYKLASGVYIYRIMAIDKSSGKNFTNVKKMMLLK